jgi:hypothetical protein
VLERRDVADMSGFTTSEILMERGLPEGEPGSHQRRCG